MAQTVIRGGQVKDNTIQRVDLDTSTVGQAVVTKIVQGTNVVLGSTGADSGTGDVTINVPGGGQGPAGLNAFNITSGSFTVPAVGSTVNVTLNDASWVTVGQYVYVDQAAGGVGQAGLLQVTAKTGNQITLLNPTTPPTIPLADATQSGLLRQVSGNTTDFVDGTNNSQALAPVIWNARLRSFSATSNPNFEVDQRNVGTTVSNPAGGAFILDRWSISKGGTMAANWAQTTGSIVVPNTNFWITRSFLRCTLTTQESSLGAGDLYSLAQVAEGTVWRELAGDVTSISVLVKSSVAGLKFGVSIRDSTGVTSLTKLCTIPSANTWTLITLPNLPVPSSGTFGLFPGQVGYYFNITLACGTTYTASANDTWQSGNFMGAVGQSNFAASAVNSTFDIAFVQHESGAVCTTLMDKPFSQNYNECLKYYSKSYEYITAPGTASSQGGEVFLYCNNPSAFATGYVPFPVTMAKTPNLGIFNPITGALGSVQEFPSGTNRATASAEVTSKALSFLNITSLASGQMIRFHYTADTGW